MTDWRTVTNTLVDNLGTGLVSLIVGVAPETIIRWTKGTSANPREANERRMREAFRIYLELAATDSPHTVRAWFMGSNPELGNDSPAEALSEDRFKEVFAAARSFQA
ncbi:hypothetical protein DRB06_11310 [Actinomyces sp. Z5]|uniref:Precursor signal transcriptional probable rv1990c/mt2044 regulatory mb3210 mb2012c n=2 Tax=Actinomycetaceae TaxID=2049 RepID=A0A1M4RZH7_9ACTO|nr:hypothetical protein DRB07_15095 [Actinomyces sp. Z3]RAX19806.1 hypothetical protein DRB06_11310 [Actinomyces sp. Z5]SHE25384.1 precursor signal transcriptional probable rv1990c/mt2044 regulatory mb3210 mb2012c [Actinomyces glycerinitolerans]